MREIFPLFENLLVQCDSWVVSTYKASINQGGLPAAAAHSRNLSKFANITNKRRIAEVLAKDGLREDIALTQQLRMEAGLLEAELDSAYPFKEAYGRADLSKATSSWIGGCSCTQP